MRHPKYFIGQFGAWFPIRRPVVPLHLSVLSYSRVFLPLTTRRSEWWFPRHWGFYGWSLAASFALWRHVWGNFGDSQGLTVPQRLSHEVGWGYKDVVDRLEDKRKLKAQAFHERKVRPFFRRDTTWYWLVRPDRCPQAPPEGHFECNTIIPTTGSAWVLDSRAGGCVGGSGGLFLCYITALHTPNIHDLL